MSASRFMVTFTDDTTYEIVDKAKKALEENGGKIIDDFRPLMKGFSAVIPEEAMDCLKSDSVVGDKIKRIEKDGEVKIQG